MLEAQMRAQRVDAAVGGRAVRAHAALRRVRVVVVPAVGHLLAAWLAAPEGRALCRRDEHAVVRVLRRRRHATSAVPQHALCEQQPIAARLTTPRRTALTGQTLTDKGYDKQRQQ